MSNLQVLNYGYIRETEDGRYSVFDTIEVLADKKNPRETFKRLCNRLITNRLSTFVQVKTTAQ